MDGTQFELEVRNIARAMWPTRPGSGAAMIIDKRERDCIFEDEHLTHYLEITTSKKLQTIRENVDKMVAYRADQAKKGGLVKLWIVTLDEPTADQRSHCRKNNVEILSIVEFRRYIFDAHKYLEIRQNHSFGSASDPVSDSSDISKIKYQPVAIHSETSKTSIKIAEVVSMINERKQVVLLGDYGMGKSINIHELFLTLRKEYLSSKSGTAYHVPIVLNLREHWGQSDPAEALRRHADLVGFEKPHQLVQAFNAGRLAVLLDGFDEVGATPWAHMQKSRAQDLRKNAVSLVNRFMRSANGKCGILVAGREHFFDNRNELISSLGLCDSAIFLNLDEFSDGEAKCFLAEQGIATDTLPDWFPRRPLLLASLAGKDLLGLASDVSKDVEPAVAWDTLVSLICDREAQIHRYYLDESSIRRILEQLASEARKSSSNVGPVSEDQIVEAFRSVVGIYPDEPARLLLQRLPGLSIRNQQDGVRSFLDDQMLDILRSGHLLRYIQSPFTDPHAKAWCNGIKHVGARLVAVKMPNKNTAELLTAARTATSKWSSPTLAIDCIQVIQQLVDDDSFDCHGLHIEEGDCDVLDLQNLPVPANFVLKNSCISQLTMPLHQPSGFKIEACHINQVIGVSEGKNLPNWCNKCSIEQFDISMTNAKILEEKTQPVPIRVMLTILKKLYRQRGSSRLSSAFYRGMDDKAKAYVDDILKILVQERLIFHNTKPGCDIWHRVAGQQQRALSIIDRVGKISDPIIAKVRGL